MRPSSAAAAQPPRDRGRATDARVRRGPARLPAWPFPALLVLACASPPPRETTDDRGLVLALGEEVYLEHCARCHGESGRGDGPEGRELRPPPRDLVTGHFEYKSTPGADPPTDEDLERTLIRGVLDEGMPSFAVLAPEERRAVIQYIRSLAARR